jgi:protein SCO1/2
LRTAYAVAARRLAVAALAALLLPLTACGSSGDNGTGAPVTGFSSSDDDGYNGIKLDQDYVVPDLTLTDTEKRPFDLARQDKRTVVFFGYTHCPDICQVVMSTIASAMAKLSQADQARLQVVFVTTDPARDTTAVLRTYLDRFNPAFVGLTGSLSQINTLGKPMGIEVMKGQKLPSGGYEVDHTTNVVSVRADKGDLVWTASTSPSDMAGDLHKILKADA